MRSSPTMDPPEPPEPCLGCGEQLTSVEAVNEQKHDDGAVTADLACPACGEIVAEGELVEDPDHV